MRDLHLPTLRWARRLIYNWWTSVTALLRKVPPGEGAAASAQSGHVWGWQLAG